MITKIQRQGSRDRFGDIKVDTNSSKMTFISIFRGELIKFDGVTNTTNNLGKIMPSPVFSGEIGNSNPLVYMGDIRVLSFEESTQRDENKIEALNKPRTIVSDLIFV